MATEINAVPATFVEPNLQTKSVEYVTNGDRIITFDSPYTGLSQLNIKVDVPEDFNDLIQTVAAKSGKSQNSSSTAVTKSLVLDLIDQTVPTGKSLYKAYMITGGNTASSSSSYLTLSMLTTITECTDLIEIEDDVWSMSYTDRRSVPARYYQIAGIVVICFWT